MGRSKASPPNSIAHELDAAAPRPASNAASVTKKNYAERLSRALALCMANALRPDFPGILPDAEGVGQESKAGSAMGYKKLDVNYSTTELGLALGVSIKSINFRDGTTKRYTKNYSRNDAELRAEATDYHVRQPYAALVGVLFLPADAADDGKEGKKGDVGASSFGAAVKYFRRRAGRSLPGEDPDRFEKFFVALYEHEPPLAGAVAFFDVENDPPRARRPRADEVLDFAGFLRETKQAFLRRNSLEPFCWADD